MGGGLKVGDKVVRVDMPGALGTIVRIQDRSAGQNRDVWVKWPRYEDPLYHWECNLKRFVEPPATPTAPERPSAKAKAALRELTEMTEAVGGYDKELGDPVNHPDHYKQGDIECIDAIQAALTPEEFRGYCKGNALKYVWREKHKGGDESVRKAIWYLNRLVTK